MQVKPFILLKGLATYVPGAREYFCSSSGGTVSARYCYAVWMRHLIKADESGFNTNLDKVAELGPGDSLGIGLCAVLCGANEYYALDTKAHASLERNKQIFEELVIMFKNRETIPGATEFPAISPDLKEDSFPRHILTDDRLRIALHPDRIAAIRKALTDAQNVSDIHITYIAPWQDNALHKVAGTLDMVFSQAVMEHVEQVEATYAALYHWLKPGGFMSHAIDYKSHGYTKDWYGHWTTSELTWKLIKGNRPYLINRLPHSSHTLAMQKVGFKILNELRKKNTPLTRQKVANKFQTLSDDDLSTSGAFIQAIKPTIAL